MANGIDPDEAAHDKPPAVCKLVFVSSAKIPVFSSKGRITETDTKFIHWHSHKRC